jgi:spermidine/putrescine transport system ATP-binding protein
VRALHSPAVADERTAGVTLEGISKRFGNVEAVRDVWIVIRAGEFFSLLGPSGCGKTTSLRIIAGFERPDEGRVLLGEQDVTEVPPHKRPVNTVFQSYALFPHLSVGENVGFGLRFTSLDRPQKRRKVADALALVRLEGFEKRKPHQLSGGQQQRVALARALVLNPSVLLLDEPLGALDAKLRRALQLELKTIQREVGITFLYVTHDQEEALTMSDRLAVMSQGHVEQLGTPRDVYEEPTTVFVADFLGVSNLMRARSDGNGRVRLGDTALAAGQGATDVRGEAQLTIRPERIRVEPHGATGENRVSALVDQLVFVGSATQVFLRLSGGQSLHALVPNTGELLPYAQGDAVTAHLPPDALRVLAGGASPAPSGTEVGELVDS